MEFLKIHDPDKPGDYLVISRKDFDPSKHRRFESEPPAESAPTESARESEGDAKKPKRKG
mgnify:CR=1 FL=1